MRLILTAAALAALIGLPAAAQTAGGGAGSAASPGMGLAKGAAASPPAAGPRVGLARMATSHAQIADRLSHRDAGAAKDTKLAQAAQAANAAVEEDPTVRRMLDAAMSQPPSLAGGPPPSPNGINPP